MSTSHFIALHNYRYEYRVGFRHTTLCNLYTKYLHQYGDIALPKAPTPIASGINLPCKTVTQVSQNEYTYSVHGVVIMTIILPVFVLETFLKLGLS